MSVRMNPFQELYVTEAFADGGEDKFVKGFSPVIVKHALGLFQPGNIVLKGLPGSGKSMLLNLLRPDIRIQYSRADVPFPVPREFSKFIGAGINLNRSGADRFGQRPFDRDPETDAALAPLYFADFVNCWLVFDVLTSLISIRDSKETGLAKAIGVSDSVTKLRDAAVNLSRDDCWFGYFDGAVTDEILFIEVASFV